jgi:DNA end-binding protein Ku
VPNRGGARSYRLLLQAMRDTDKVAIGRVVLRSRQQLVAIHPREDALVMTTMNFGDEVVPTSELHELHEDKVELSDNELEIAHRLVDSIARPFDPANYRDTYREALLDLIDRKASGEQVVLEPPTRDLPLEAPDLMSALEASIEQARARRAREDEVFDGAAGDVNGVPASAASPSGRGARGGRGAGKGNGASGRRKATTNHGPAAKEGPTAGKGGPRPAGGKSAAKAAPAKSGKSRRD